MHYPSDFVKKKKQNKTKQNKTTTLPLSECIPFNILYAAPFFNVALKIYSSLFQASMNEITLTG